MSIQQTATLNVGEKCLDFSSWRDMATLQALNVKCVMRYVYTGGTSFPGKVAYNPEIKTYLDAGIGVLLMFEAGQADPLKGYSKGLTHGRQAVQSCEALGYPHGLPVFAAVDFDATVLNLPACIAYMRGFRDGLNLAYATGVYGDTDIIGACSNLNIASYFHYAGASSWSHHEWLDIIHLRQSITGSGAGKYDNNYVFRPVPMWLPHEVADIPLPPSQQELDMSTYTQFDVPGRFYDSRDPQAPNKLQANVARDINTGQPDAKVAIFHCEAVLAEGSGSLVFWSGNTAHPNVTSVGIQNGYGQSLVSAPVVNGHVTVQSGIPTHLVLDLHAIIS